MDEPTARTATTEYRKPEVYALGSVRDLTCWEKTGGSADAWGMQAGDPDGGSADPGVVSH